MLKKFEQIPTKILLAIVFFLLAAIVLLVQINKKDIKTASATWWDDTWRFRQAIDIGWTGSLQTDYQISFDIGSSALIAANKMQSDCDDIRVTDENGNLIPHWTGNCNTSSTHIWIKIPSLPTGGVTIYFYYGNSAATSTSDVHQTFNFYNEPITGGANAYSSNTSGVSVSTTTTENGVTPLAENYMIKFIGTIGSTSNPYAYYRIYEGGTTDYFDNYVVQDGDFLTFFVNNYDTPGVGLEINFTDSSVLRWTHDDQDAIDVQLENTEANGYWYWRYVDISDMAGKTVNYISVVQEDPTPTVSDSWIGYFNGITIQQYDPGFSSTPQSEELSPGPIVYYKFDEGTGTTAYSSTGIANGSITGASWQTEASCISGKCLSFNGTSNAVDINSLTTYPSTWDDPFSISTWIYVPSSATWTNGYYGNIISRGSYTGSHGLNRDSSVNNQIRMWVRGDNGVVSATGLIERDKWQHIAGTWNGTTVSLYINGLLVNSGGSARTGTPGATAWYIARNTAFSGSNGNWFEGYLDEVKIYAYARSADQIKSDYIAGSSSSGSSAVFGHKSETAQVTPIKSKLVAHWKFDETVGSIAHNFSSVGSTLDATLAGSAYKKSVKAIQNGNIRGYTALTNSSLVSFERTSPFTISVWIKATRGGQYGSLLSKLNGSQGYQLYLCGNEANCTYDRLRFRLTNTSATNEIMVYVDSTGTRFNAGLWHHVVITYDGSSSASGVNIYVDDIKQNTTTAYNNLSSTITNSSSLTIGSASIPLAFYDELKIYNSVLSKAEIDQDYNVGNSTKIGSYARESDHSSMSTYSIAGQYCVPGQTGGANFRCAPPQLELKFEEGVGTTAYDTGGKSHNGVISGTPIWTGGHIGGALQFTGSQYITVSSDIHTYFGMTINFWFKKSDINAGAQYFMDSRNTGIWWLLQDYVSGACTDSNGNICFYGLVEIPSSYLSNDTWYFVSVTANATTSKIYLNGQLIDTGSGTTVRIGPNLTIGTRYTQSAYFEGYMDNIVIYDYVRDQTQIAWDYNRGGPVGWWKLDETVGSTAHDSSGNGHNGTLGTGTSAPTWTTGKLSNALSFDGTSKYVQIADNDAYSTSDMSLSLWFKDTDDAATFHGLISKYSSSADWLLRIRNDVLNFSQDGGANFLAGTTLVNDNQWHHVVATYDSTTDSRVIYLDGKVEASDTDSNNIPNTSNYILIGIDYTVSSGRNMNGLIDDVRIYNYALTPELVKTLYTGGSISFTDQ